MEIGSEASSKGEYSQHDSEEIPVDHKTEWVSPAETNSPKDRAKFLVRRSVNFDKEEEMLKGVQWFVEAGDTFVEVYSEEIEST